MEKKLNYKQVAELIRKEPLSAEEIAKKLNLDLSHQNRDRTLAIVRRLARKAIKVFGGNSDQLNDENQKVYQI